MTIKKQTKSKFFSHLHQRGSLLIGAVAMIVTIALLGATISHLFISKTRGGADVSNGNEALILAESGIEHAKYALSLNPAYSGESNTSFSGGSFTISILNTDFSGTSLPADQVRISSTGTVSGAGGTQAIRTTEAIVSIGVGNNDIGWAVGDNSLTLQWDGSNWTSISNPGSDDLKGVFCNSPSNCWAVGKNGTIMLWNGSSWSSVASGTGDDLESVSCDPSNASHCFAVGENGTISYWNGSSWSASTPSPGEDLKSVDCPSDICFAVGDDPTILRYDSGSTSWIDESYGSKDLSGINCTSDSNCWSVGKRFFFFFYILRRTGSGWSNALLFSFNGNDLDEVSCLNPIDGRCWAVGKQGKTTFFNGTSWSYLSSGSSRDLKDVWCSQSSIDCWTVGRKNGANLSILRWEGSSWTQTAVGVTPVQDLEGVHFPPSGGGSDIITVIAWRELAS